LEIGNSKLEKTGPPHKASFTQHQQAGRILVTDSDYPGEA